MRIGQVVAKVVLSRVHPLLVGAQFKIVLPLTFNDIAEPLPEQAAIEETSSGDPNAALEKAVNRLENPDFPRKWGNDLVVFDDCSAAIGEWVAFSEGAEAAAAFGKEHRPVDAFAGAILDTVVIDGPVVAALVEAKNKR